MTHSGICWHRGAQVSLADTVGVRVVMHTSMDAQSGSSALRAITKDRGNNAMTHSSFFERLLGSFLASPEGTTKHNGLRAGLIGGLLAFAGVPLVASSALAQTPEVAGGTTTSDTLEEIVVTAQKFEQNLEKTPVPVTAVTEESLRVLGITTTPELTELTPNLVVAPTTSSAQLAIRGAVSTTVGDEGDPAVAFNVDGVYLARPRAAITALYDVDRVEVLRGPQGTLWGRNAIGGAINVITNKPTTDGFAVEGELQYGNYNELLAYGMANMPVSDTFALRIAYQSERHDGYANNAPARDSDDLDVVAGRLEALWKPVDNFSALLTVSSFHNGGVGLGSFNGGFNLGIYQQTTGYTPFNYPEAPGQQYEDELAQDLTLTLDWKLPWFTVTYVGGIRDDTDREASDQAVDGPIVNVFRTLTENPYGGTCLNAEDPTCTELRLLFQSRQISNELRLSNETAQLKWVLGFLYFKEDADEYGAVDPCPCNPAIGITFNYPRFSDDTHAVFGQATWSIIPSLRLTAGLRYNDDFKGQYGYLYFGIPVADLVGTGPNDCFQFCSGAPNSIDFASEYFHKVTWKAGLDYDLTPNSLLFGFVATGYKDGGFQDGLPPLNEFKPENMIDYEIGSKNMLLDRRLQINVDLFHQIWSDYQSTASEFINNQNQPITVNAGRATINGIEFESEELLTPQDRAAFDMTFMHAYFTSFPLPDGDNFDGNVPEDLAGRNLPYVPHVSLRLSYWHTFSLGTGASVVPRIDTGYVSDMNLDYHNYPVGNVPAYTRTGASLTYYAPKVWSVQLYGKNLENHAVLVSMQLDNSVPLAYEGIAGKDGVFLPPRTVGIRFNARL